MRTSVSHAIARAPESWIKLFNCFRKDLHDDDDDDDDIIGLFNDAAITSNCMTVT
jgi:hypothetical protein